MVYLGEIWIRQRNAGHTFGAKHCGADVVKRFDVRQVPVSFRDCTPMDEQKANMLPCLNGRGTQARDWDHGRDSYKSAMQTADDLFGGPQGSPRTDKLIAASVQWAEEIMRKIDASFSAR
jgi:hypothetical protein